MANTTTLGHADESIAQQIARQRGMFLNARKRIDELASIVLLKQGRKLSEVPSSYEGTAIDAPEQFKSLDTGTLTMGSVGSDFSFKLTREPNEIFPGVVAWIMDTTIAPDNSLYMLTLWRVIGGTEFPAHRHPWPEIITIVKGSGSIFVGDSLRDYKEGEAIMVPAGAVHGGRYTSDTLAVLAMPIAFNPDNERHRRLVRMGFKP
jgi:quercetin dioxygenase-like cupin family protein